MASVAQLHANRGNAKRSTGPRSAAGKAIVGGNALRGGVRSSRQLVDGESQEEFETLCSELDAALRPVGAVEVALVERIAIAVWRQRRLVTAETAALELQRRATEISRAADRLNEPGFGDRITNEDLEPFDEEQAQWCQDVLGEVEKLETINLETLADNAPLIHAQLERDAAEDEENPAQHVAKLQHGLTSYVSELALWCRKQLDKAEKRPRLMALADQLRAKHLILCVPQLDVLARYQTTLDNQLYKALRSLREAQEWRSKTLEGATENEGTTGAEPRD